MKKLLILPLIMLLGGCVSYYYPETALEDGVYYAEDDPSYVVYQGGYYGGYYGAAYYPWSSLDYFYMGYRPHCAYYYGFPCGMVLGYSPWYYPHGHWGYYSPWYASYYHYPFYPRWRPYAGFCPTYAACNDWRTTRSRDGGQDLYASNSRDGRGNRDDEVTDGNEYPANSPATPIDHGIYSTSPFSRYVSAVPAGYSGNRGMVIRKNEVTKIGKSRLEPSRSVPVTSTPRVSGSSRTVTSSRPPSASTPRASSRSSSRSRPARSPSSRSPTSRKSPVREDHN